MALNYQLVNDFCGGFWKCENVTEYQLLQTPRIQEREAQVVETASNWKKNKKSPSLTQSSHSSCQNPSRVLTAISWNFPSKATISERGFMKGNVTSFIFPEDRFHVTSQRFPVVI